MEDRPGFDRRLLKALDLSGVAVTACVQPDGKLRRVDDAFDKLLAAAQKGSLPRIHTAIVAKEQPLTQFRLDPDPQNPDLFRDPHADFHVICAHTLIEAMRLMVVNAQTRWSGIDCRLPSREPSFVGRERLMTAVRHFVNKPDSGYLVIVAGKGKGKSAFMRELIHSALAQGEKPVYHFGAPQNMLGCLYGRLQRKYVFLEPYEWEHLNIENKIERLLRYLSETPLREKQAPEILYIDLDDQAAGNTRESWSGILPALPREMRGILTTHTRPPPSPGVTVWEMDDYMDDRADARSYLRQQARRLWPPLSDTFIEQIVTRPNPPVFFTIVNRIQQLTDSIPSAAEAQELRTDPDTWVVPPEKLLQLKAPNPYKGLLAFQETDAPNFFGREALTQQLLGRLRESTDTSRFLAVVGPSGCGKSSVVKAGVIPMLRNGALPGSDKWLIVEILPGKHPLVEIANGLLSMAPNQPTDLAEQLRSDKHGLLQSVQQVLPTEDSELLLVIDQFEEAFTLTEDKIERMHFLDSLVSALIDPASRLRVIITLRADFYDRPLMYAGFSDLMRQRTEVVVPLTQDELTRAIATPAKQAGAALEEGLVTSIVTEVVEQPAMLPLLQYTLTELFERREGSLLTNRAYQAMGGVVGALTRRAEEVYAGLDAREQATAQQLFLHLVALGESAENTRRRVLHSELTSLEGVSQKVMDRVIEVFGNSRLLSLDHDSSLGEPTREVAHEALLQAWPRLREWINASQADLRLQRQLAGAAAEWLNAGRASGFLLQGARLDQFEGWAAETKLALRRDERDYLDESLTKRRALQFRNWIVIGVGIIALVLVIVATIFGINSNAAAQSRATQQAIAIGQAETQRLAAEANALLKSNGSSEMIALLSIRSMNIQYSPQGDAVLLEAARLMYPRNVFTHYPAVVWAVAFSPDGRSVLTGSADGTARLWDAQTGQELRSLGDAAGVWAVAFSPDGRSVLTGSEDGTARLWDAQTGQELLSFTGHTAGVDRVVFSPDERYVLTGSEDETARLWDAQTGKELLSFTGHTAGIHGVAFSPDGQHVLTSGADGTARIWDARIGKELHSFHHANLVYDAVFSPDGHYILTGSDDGTARLWDVESGQELRSFIGHVADIWAVAFSPDGQYVLTGSSDKTARLWDAQTGQEINRFTDHTNTVDSVAFSPDSRYVLTGSIDGTALLWDTQAGMELPEFTGHSSNVNGVTFSPDGRYILSGGNDKIARLWDTHTGQELHSYIGHTDLLNYGVAISPDDRYVLTGSWDQTARLWDAQTERELLSFTGHTAGVNSVAFSPDGRYVLTGSDDMTARLWNTQTGKELLSFIGHTGAVYQVAFSPDGQYIVTSSADQTARLWNTQTGQEIRLFIGHTAEVNGIAFSPDSRYVLTGSDDKTARLWDARTGQELRSFIGHTGSIWSVAFSPDSKHAATSSVDGTARLWDIQTGQELRRLIGSGAGVNSIDFSPDGQYLATANDDATVRLWDTDYHITIQYLCSRLLRDFADDEWAQYNLTDKSPTCPKH